MDANANCENFADGSFAALNKTGWCLPSEECRGWCYNLIWIKDEKRYEMRDYDRHTPDLGLSAEPPGHRDQRPHSEYVHTALHNFGP